MTKEQENELLMEAIKEIIEVVSDEKYASVQFFFAAFGEHGFQSSTSVDLTLVKTCLDELIERKKKQVVH